MSIYVNVVNQQLVMASMLDSVVSGSQEFVKFKFNLDADWDGLTTLAQFGQNGYAYNEYLDSDNCVYLPHEIGAGACTLMLYGSGGTTIATTNYLTLKVDGNILISDAQSTQFSQSLYDRLMLEFESTYNGKMVRCDAEQTLTDEQKRQARWNIDAAGHGALFYADDIHVPFTEGTRGYLHAQSVKGQTNIGDYIVGKNGAICVVTAYDDSDENDIVLVIAGTGVQFPFVLYDAAQTLTDTQQEQVRSNIGAINLPTVSASDNGKLLQVVGGAWSAVTIENAAGGSY